MSTVDNTQRDRTTRAIQAHRLADEHAVIRPQLDRLMSYARRVYAAAIPMLTSELQGYANDVLAGWDLAAIQKMDDLDHAWVCHHVAQLCVGMRIALSKCHKTDLRPELQLCHLALESPWSVRLEVAVAEAHEAAAISAKVPGIVDMVSDYGCLDACQPVDVEAIAVRAAMHVAREGCYGILDSASTVVESNTSMGEQVDITAAWCALGNDAVEAIVQADQDKDPAPKRRRRGKPDTIASVADLQAVIAGHIRQQATDRAVALAVERLDALGTKDEVVPEAMAVVAEPEVVAAVEPAPALGPLPARGKVVALMGPSGAGKTSILEALLAGDPGLVRSVSWTTRSPREGEQDGVDYHFRCREQFDALVAADGMLEHDTVYGRSYGIPRAPIEAALQGGRTVVLVIHVDGFRRLQAALPGDVVGVGVLASSPRVLEARLLARGDEQESVDARMRAAGYEADATEVLADHVIVNRRLPEAIEQVRALLLGRDHERMAA